MYIAPLHLYGDKHKYQLSYLGGKYHHMQSKPLIDVSPADISGNSVRGHIESIGHPHTQ